MFLDVFKYKYRYIFVPNPVLKCLMASDVNSPMDVNLALFGFCEFYNTNMENVIILLAINRKNTYSILHGIWSSRPISKSAPYKLGPQYLIFKQNFY